MAFTESQPEVSLLANTTFAKTDLYKFVELTTLGRVAIGDSTAANKVIGNLYSITATTAGAGAEYVTVGLMSGIGKVYMAESTEHAGKVISASSAGLGVTPTTDALQLGIIVDGSSGSTGRIASVLFGPKFDV